MEITEIEELGKFFIIHMDDGGAYAQRKQMNSTIESPLTPQEIIIIALCEMHMRRF